MPDSKHLVFAVHGARADRPDFRPPGPVGRWLTEVFNDWPEGSRAAALAAEIADPPVWHTRDDHP